MSRQMLASRQMRSSLALIASTGATAVLGMVFWTAAAWIFDPAELGRGSAGTSAMMVLGTLGQLALTSVFARVLPAMPGGLARFITGAYVLMTVASAVLTAAFFAAGLGKGFMHAEPLNVLAFAVAVIATAMSAVQDGALVALGRSAWVPAKNSVLALAKLALLPLLASTPVPAPILVAWSVPTAIAVVVLNIVLFRRIIPARAAEPANDAIPPTRHEIVRLLGGQYANSIVNACTLMFPPVLVAMVLGPEANAIFFLPWTITTALMALVWNVVMPFVVEASSDPKRLAANLRQMVRAGLLITLGGAALLVVLGPTLLALAGDHYASQSTPTIRLLAIALPFVTVASFFNAAELIRLRSSLSLAAKVLAAVLFLGGAVPAMHALGVKGAADAFLVSQAVVGLILFVPVVSWYRSLVVKDRMP